MQLRNLAIALVTAPELLLIAITWALHFHYPDVFALIGSKLSSQSESWKYVAAATTALFVWSVKAFSDIRNPTDTKGNKALYEWPHYSLLLGRLYLALVTSFISMILAIALWLLGQDLSPSIIGALSTGALAVSVTVAASLTFARDALKQLLAQHGG